MSIHSEAPTRKQAGPFAGGLTASNRARQEAEAVRDPGFRWRGEILSVNLLIVLLGGWMIASPWALSYSGSDVRINAWACGGAICLLTVVSALGLARDLLRWFTALIGVWLMITVVTIAHGSAARWNDFLIGVLVFLASSALWELGPGALRRPA